MNQTLNLNHTMVDSAEAIEQSDEELLEMQDQQGQQHLLVGSAQLAAQTKRKEKARIAARARRGQEANIIMQMADELNITQEKMRRIDKATIVKLAIDYIKAFELLCRYRNISSNNNSSEREYKVASAGAAEAVNSTDHDPISAATTIENIQNENNIYCECCNKPKRSAIITAAAAAAAAVAAKNPTASIEIPNDYLRARVGDRTASSHTIEQQEKTLQQVLVARKHLNNNQQHIISREERPLEEDDYSLGSFEASHYAPPAPVSDDDPQLMKPTAHQFNICKSARKQFAADNEDIRNKENALTIETATMKSELNTNKLSPNQQQQPIRQLTCKTLVEKSNDDEQQQQQQQQQQQVASGVAKGEELPIHSAPKLTTSSIFSPKTTENMNSHFLMIKRERDGKSSFVLKPDAEIQEEDDLTHLAPQAGDVSILLEVEEPLEDIILDDTTKSLFIQSSDSEQMVAAAASSLAQTPPVASHILHNDKDHTEDRKLSAIVQAQDAESNCMASAASAVEDDCCDCESAAAAHEDCGEIAELGYLRSTRGAPATNWTTGRHLYTSSAYHAQSHQEQQQHRRMQHKQQQQVYHKLMQHHYQQLHHSNANHEYYLAGTETSPQSPGASSLSSSPPMKKLHSTPRSPCPSATIMGGTHSMNARHQQQQRNNRFMMSELATVSGDQLIEHSNCYNLSYMGTVD